MTFAEVQSHSRIAASAVNEPCALVFGDAALRSAFEFDDGKMLALFEVFHDESQSRTLEATCLASRLLRFPLSNW